MRDHNHHSPDNTGFCEHCGQPLPSAQVVSYGDKKPVNRVGIGVTILLHCLLLLAYFLKPQVDLKKSAPAAGEITYVSPLPGKPKPKEQSSAPKQQTKPRPEKPSKPSPPVLIKRLPNTITLPEEQPQKVVEEPAKPKPVPHTDDMMADLEARRKARGQDSTQQQAEESEADRGTRIAKANIAAANGRSQGNDPNDTGGVFSLTNKTFATADLKFRGWNQNFKRRWLQQVRVERGNEPDIETAIIKKMIELIRKEKTGDFEWDSHRLQRVVTMSARPQDQAELEAFLFKEMFPDYRKGPGR